MSTEALEKMLTKGMDNALLRFGLGKAHLDGGNTVQAAEHLQRCVEFDPAYSAAWKLLAACRTFPLAGRIAHRSWNLTV